MPDKPRCRPAGGARSWVKSEWLPADAGCPWSSEAVDKPGAGSRAWALHCRLEHADQIRLPPCGSCGQPTAGRRTQEGGMLEETHDKDQIIQRVAALDVGKAELTCCVRVSGQGGSGRRLQEVTTYQTMTRWLLVLADRLAELGVTRVVMEATSDYWKGVYYLLEAHGFEVWLVNARDVKHLPGRPKTDTLDAVWLCKLAERQLLRPSFVPPPAIRQLRDVARYRADLVAARTAEKQRVEQAAGGRPDQTLGGGQRHLRGLGAGHAGRAGRRRARPQGPRPAGADSPTCQAESAGGGVLWVLHRPARLPARQDAGPGGRPGRRPGRARRQARRADRPVHRRRRPAGRGPRARPDRRLPAHRRAGSGHDPVPDRRAPGVVGQVRPRRQRVRRQAQGPRLDRARQPVSGSGARRGCRRRRQDRYLPG